MHSKNTRKLEQLYIAEQLTKCHDDTLIDPSQVAAITGFSPVSIQQNKISGLPPSDTRLKSRRWRLGDVRDWVRAGSQKTTNQNQSNNIGRPTKARQLARLAEAQSQINASLAINAPKSGNP